MKAILHGNGTLRQRLLACFAVLAILPLLLSVLFSFRNDRQQILENRDQIAGMDVQQITRDLDMELSAYENVLYQLYTDEELSALVKDLNEDRDLAVTRNQIRRKLRGVFWLQDYITSLMVITRSGETVFYDRLSFSGQANVALEALGQNPKLLFDGLSAQNGTTYLPTRYVTFFNGQQYHLFYMGHRILSDQINRTDAVILMGIDSNLLEKTLEENWLGEGREKYMFITDSRGRLVWYPDSSRIGENLYDTGRSLTDFVAKNSLLDSRELAVYHRISEPTGWQVTSVLDCTSFTRAIDQRLVATVLVIMLSFLAAAVLVWAITGRLMQSVEQVCATMRTVSRGNLSVRADCPPGMTPEIRTIAEGLNTMADRLQALMRDREESAEKIKNAEIAALEAQLNPHFLYNTLDTLNWMAIENDQYALSNVISALGKTLRYGIDYSNAVVTVEEEAAWLKQYLFIHQNRLKSSFRCEVEIPPEALRCRVHKLFMQPFVENAMIHGFSREQEDCLLQIRTEVRQDTLQVIIEDNGVGIPRQVLDNLHTSRSGIDCTKRYHGMQNAINRLLLYYGASARIAVTSGIDRGTRIEINIPADIQKEGQDPCVS